MVEVLEISAIALTYIMLTFLGVIAWYVITMPLKAIYVHKHIDRLKQLHVALVDVKFDVIGWWRRDFYNLSGYFCHDTMGLTVDTAFRFLRNKATDEDWITLFHEITHGLGAQKNYILDMLHVDPKRNKRFHPDPDVLYAVQVCFRAFQELFGIEQKMLSEYLLQLVNPSGAYKMLGSKRYMFYFYNSLECFLEEAMANINAGMLFAEKFGRMPKPVSVLERMSYVFYKTPKTFTDLPGYPNYKVMFQETLWGAEKGLRGEQPLFPE